MTSEDFIPFALPAIGPEEISAVVATLESGWLTTGPRCRQFEEEFVDYLGTKSSAVAVNSATAGLHLALESLGIGPGDEVIVPTFTFTASAEVVRYLGATPLLADSDRATLNIDVGDLERLLATHPRVKAVMPVHIAGLACDMSAIKRLAAEFDVAVVEDAAHALPTVGNEGMVGADGELSVFSFYATKGITTGEGGMVIVSDPERAAHIRTMAFHGINRISYDRYRSRKPAWQYEVVAPGFKYNLSDIAAAIGIEQLKTGDAFLRRRTEIATRYLSTLDDLPVVLPATGGQEEIHSWHLFIIRLEVERLTLTRNEFITEMSGAGIGTSVHFIPLHLHPYWSELTGLVPSDLPVALDAFDRNVSLPIYPSMSDDEVDRVIEVVQRILLSHTV
jgi:dTDP-4-amino-4,6-dideoxygalactose transaminase